MKRIIPDIAKPEIRAIALQENYATLNLLPLDIIVLGIIIILSLLGLVVLVG